MRQFKPLLESMIIHILRQICVALKHIHGSGIIHRDIKLENVMLSEEGSGCTAKLADFGLAEKLINGRSAKPNKAGTPAYLAPEIVEGKPYGSASDMWSLGCLLYVLLTAELP